MKPIATPLLLGLFLALDPAVVKSLEHPSSDTDTSDVDSAAAGEVDTDRGFSWHLEFEDRHRHHSPMALFRRHDHAEGTCTQLLRLPMFSLYRSESWQDRRDLRILSLPIIGSLYRHRVDGNSHRREFLYLIDIESREGED